MAAKLLSDIEGLETTIREIITRYRRLENRNRELEEENAELRREKLEAEDRMTRAELDCEYLQVSHKLADNPETLAETRRRVAGLIRNIDRCLEMLRE